MTPWSIQILLNATSEINEITATPVTLNQGIQLHFHWEPAPLKMSSRATQYTHDNIKLVYFKGKQNNDGLQTDSLRSKSINCNKI